MLLMTIIFLWLPVNIVITLEYHLIRVVFTLGKLKMMLITIMEYSPDKRERKKPTKKIRNFRINFRRTN